MIKIVIAILIVLVGFIVGRLIHTATIDRDVMPDIEDVE